MIQLENAVGRARPSPRPSPQGRGSRNRADRAGRDSAGNSGHPLGSLAGVTAPSPCSGQALRKKGMGSHRNDPAIYRSQPFDTWQLRRGADGFVDAVGSLLFVDVSLWRLCHSIACRSVFAGMKTASGMRRKKVEIVPPSATQCHFWGRYKQGRREPHEHESSRNLGPTCPYRERFRRQVGAGRRS